MALKIFPRNTLKSVSGLLFMVAMLAIVAMLAMLSACGSPAGQPDSRSAGQQSSSAGLRIQLYADKFEFTSPEQFCQTLFTAEVVVGSHGVARWNTPDGKLPAGVMMYADVVKKDLRIYTPVTFTRLVALVDHRHVATKGYVTIGGNVGNDSYTIDEDPSLTGTGGHFIVVLYPSTPQTGGNTEAVLVVGNAYPVDAQGMVILQQAANPNEPGPGQLQPAITISLASLKQQLASCKS